MSSDDLMDCKVRQPGRNPQYERGCLLSTGQATDANIPGTAVLGAPPSESLSRLGMLLLTCSVLMVFSYIE
jgi:hypothetical protein